MIIEFCAENFTDVPEALDAGANRVELCDNLAVGGTTPSLGVLKASQQYCAGRNVPIRVMIRPRGGDFVYSAVELEMMQEDIKVCRDIGVEGLAFGCLTEAGELDKEAMQLLLSEAGNLKVTCHMAFDHITPEQQKEALDWLVDHDVDCILTHGGVDGTVLDNAAYLNDLIEHADGRIDILVGGGVNYQNLPDVKQHIASENFHGTKIVDY